MTDTKPSWYKPDKINSVQRIKPIKIDATKKQMKQLKKAYAKANFTRWQRMIRLINDYKLIIIGRFK